MSPSRRHALCCGAAAVAGLFSSLLPAAASAAQHPLAQAAFDGLDANLLWDVHTHLLGTGDSGSGCRIHAHMREGFHPMAQLRRRVIMAGAGVPADAPSIDEAYVARLARLAQDFPAGARWLLFAFASAIDDSGRERDDWTTFHVPDAHAARVAAGHAARFGWVASIHPYREDALTRLDQALADGAMAVKWLPSAMHIDLRDARCQPFYQRLAAAGVPLIVHCGEEKAVPGAEREDLGNPLLVRWPLAAGVRVIVAHCASLGRALDLDARRPGEVSAFSLFARLMDERAWQSQLLGDISALFQVNRPASAWRTVLARQDWHERLLHGSDWPLPGVRWLFRPASLVSAGLLDEGLLAPLADLQQANPLLFDLALKRQVRLPDGRALRPCVFETARHFRVDRVSPANTQRSVGRHMG